MSLEFALGRQLTVDFYDCSARILADCERLKAVFVDAARRAGATILDSYFHDFEPQGSSGVVIIAESHFAVHAWPEYGYAAVDLFTCSETVDFGCAVAVLKEGMAAGSAVVSEVFTRGRVEDGVLGRALPVDFQSELAETTPAWENHFRASRARAMSVSIDVFDCDRPEELGEWLAATGVDRDAVAVNRSDDGRTVYLDIFGRGFMEPRPLAEAAMNCFAGGHYTMKVHLRH